MHQKYTRRILSAALSSLLLASLLSSCSSPSAPQDTTELTGQATAAPSTEPATEAYYPDLPDSDFGGHEFNILHWYGVDWESHNNRDIYAEAETGDVLNDAVYRRNKKIEEDYNVKIKIQNEDLGKIVSLVKKSVSAGDDIYDAVYCRMYEVPQLITGGYLMDLGSIPYINLSDPWWDRNSVESLSIQDKLFMAASDINVIDKDATSAVLFNKKFAQDNALPDLYQLVKDGKWTIDKVTELSKLGTRDLNGNGSMDAEDIWGFLGANDVTLTFFQGGGGYLAQKDDADLPYYVFNKPESYDILDKVFTLMYDTGNFYNHHTGTANAPATDDNEYRDMFANGHGLFYWTRLDEVTALRSTETEFGILPVPKYSEEQAEYNSLVSIHTCGLLSVPITAQDTERTGIIISALAAESRYTVQPAYYDISLKSKYVRDDDSAEMLDLIFSNRIYDIGIIYDFGGFSGQLGGIAKTKSTDVLSLYEKNEAKIQKDIDKYIELFKNA